LRTVGTAGAFEAEGVVSAPLFRRLAALGYEALLLIAVTLIVGFLITPLMSPAATGAHSLQVPELPARVFAFCAVFAAGALYFGWSWSGGRRTLPMKTWHMAVVRAQGSPLDRRTALARYLAAWIGPAAALAAYLILKPAGIGLYALWLVGLNFIWAAGDPGRLFLHDRLAATRVVMAT
jgi:uncharacterized RDD family membrane protein YckC